MIEHHETPRARRTATSPRAGRAGEGPHTSPRRPRGSQRLALHTEKLCPDKMTSLVHDLIAACGQAGSRNPASCTPPRCSCPEM